MRKRLGAVALAMALAFGVQGCYGKFALTKKLHKWNGTVGNKFVNEAVFLVIGVILPVYGIAALIDGVILNSIEFWSGKNPVTSKVISEGDKQVAMDFDKATGLVKVSYYEAGVLKSEGFLKKNSGSVEVLDAAKNSIKTVAFNASAAAVVASR